MKQRLKRQADTHPNTPTGLKAERNLQLLMGFNPGFQAKIENKPEGCSIRQVSAS